MKKKLHNAPESGLDTEKVPTVRIISLGCAKNLVDTEQAAASLLIYGFGLTGENEDADLMFINTCAFLKASRQEAEGVIRSAKKWKSGCPGRKIIVAGCIIEWDKDGSFRAKYPEVDAWVPVASASELGRIAAGVWYSPETVAEMERRCGKNVCCPGEAPRLQLTPSHFAYLRVADGCDNCCTYCLIPMIRGPLRSRGVSEIVREAEQLLANGVRELIVIAQDTAAFGRDRTGKPCLAELLQKLDRLPGDYILRLMYLHPASVTDELLDVMAAGKHLVKCIEMPLQHISDPVLAAMHRHISESELRDKVRKIQQKGFAIRTTFMTGFPGETAEDFEKLKEFVKETGFTRLGTFAYSREAGTPAAAMANRVPNVVAEARAAELMKIQAEISVGYNRRLIGNEVDVIIDEVSSRGFSCGRTFFDAPEIDNTVLIRGAKACRPGDFVRVRVTSASEYEIKGTLVP